MRTITTVVLFCALLISANICAAADAKPDNAKPAAPLDPVTATLDQAVEAWIAALDKDDKDAATKWTKDENAKGEAEKFWDNVKKAHAKYDYRKSALPGAKAIGEKTEFKVGGHDMNHMHTDWEKTDKGWRIKRVWMCR